MKEFAHLSKFEKTLFSGAEWLVKASPWLVMQLDSGVIYACSGPVRNELPRGGLLVVPPNSPVTVLVSVLGEARLHGICINISSLSGVLTLSERLCLEREAARECAPFRQLAADHPLATRMESLFQRQEALALPVRLGMMYSFAEWLSPFLAKAAAKKNNHDGEKNPKLRLRQFVNEMPESELVELSMGDIARRLCCCERHASRLFHQVCGTSFRRYLSELRLKRACHLLVHGDQKIIDVALESGHSSLALFNYNFKNRFRMTPTEWRERYLAGESRTAKATLQAAAVA